MDQQLGAEPAPGAIDLTLPEPGRVLTFTRSLQVDGEAPLALRLTVGRIRYASLGYGLFAMLAVAAIAAVPPRRGRGASRAPGDGIPRILTPRNPP